MLQLSQSSWKQNIFSVNLWDGDRASAGNPDLRPSETEFIPLSAPFKILISAHSDHTCVSRLQHSSWATTGSSRGIKLVQIRFPTKMHWSAFGPMMSIFVHVCSSGWAHVCLLHLRVGFILLTFTLKTCESSSFLFYFEGSVSRSGLFLVRFPPATSWFLSLPTTWCVWISSDGGEI